MLKYFFYLLLPLLLIDCNGRNQRTPYPPGTTGVPQPNLNRHGNCFYGYMKDINSGIYELFLADSHHFGCGKTGGQWLVNKQIHAGSSACKNWTGTPNVEITFDSQFTQILKLQITPRGSGGSFVGNSGQLGIPGVFPANAPINPQNEDRGWNAKIPSTGHTGGNIELYCRNCDFNENRDMSIQVLYRDQPVGTLLINPQSTITRCQSTGTPPHHAYRR